MNSRYKELQELTAEYGRETISFLTRVKDLGPKIIAAYGSFLEGPRTAVSAVPPDTTTFNPGHLYRDEAFDSHKNGTVFLEPIRMGVCTVIGNKSNNGSTWVRTVLEFRPVAEGVILAVGERNKQFTIKSNLDAVLPDICESILQDVREAFSLELDDAKSLNRIGFLTGK